MSPRLAGFVYFGVEPPVEGHGLAGLFPPDLTGYHDGAEFSLPVALELVRAMLRDRGAWCRVKAGDLFTVHVGWDQYVYVGSDRRCTDAMALTRKLGLFPEPLTASPYAEELEEREVMEAADEGFWARVHVQLASRQTVLLEEASVRNSARWHRLTPENLDAVRAGLGPRALLTVWPDLTPGVGAVLAALPEEDSESKRVLALVKAFLKAGILSEDGLLRDNDTGTPQGSILSPLLSNVALSVLDEHIAQPPGGAGTDLNGRRRRRRRGLPNYRLVRYADDWCLMVHGTKADAETLRAEIAEVLTTMGLRLSPEKTLITHIEQGLDFLVWHIQRHRKPDTNRYYVYTYPAKKALRAIMAKVKALCREVGTNQPLDALLARINPAVRGWCAYFRPGVSFATFS
ncbi:reverse transcriptase domain-containing protein [Streptomyces sp. NPDC006649]|uniref:reverse transcriptase domain-containing protein n=1 Tax=Streptomyces sp. NPDC006649 TaxID=3156896 RepID=UPI0033AF3584